MYSVSGVVNGSFFKNRKVFKSKNILSSGYTGSAAASASLVHALNSKGAKGKFYLLTDSYHLSRKDEVLAYAKKNKKNLKQYSSTTNDFFDVSDDADLSIIYAKTIKGGDLCLAKALDKIVDEGSASILVNISSLSCVFGSALWTSILRAARSQCAIWLVEREEVIKPEIYRDLYLGAFLHLVFSSHSTINYKFDPLSCLLKSKPLKHKVLKPGECLVFSKQKTVKNKILKTDYISYRD